MLVFVSFSRFIAPPSHQNESQNLDQRVWKTIFFLKKWFSGLMFLYFWLEQLCGVKNKEPEGKELLFHHAATFNAWTFPYPHLKSFQAESMYCTCPEDCWV